MAFIQRKIMVQALAISSLVGLCWAGAYAANPEPSPSPSPSPSSSQCAPGECSPPTKQVSFTLACTFIDNGNPTGYKNCQISSTFNKAVTLDGGEVVDNSDLSNDPTLLLSCDGNVLYNSHAYRQTNELDTIIQGESGPMPSFTLDRGELHDGNHVAPSYLSVNIGTSFITTPGTCRISATP